MKKMYLFEIEADEKPIYTIGEWEILDDLTQDPKLSVDPGEVVAYGETKDGKYTELYEKITVA